MIAEIELLVCLQIEFIFEFTCILPVEDVCLLYHAVNVVLDVANERNFVDVELFEEIYELLLNFYVQLPYLSLSLLGACLEASETVFESLAIQLKAFDQLVFFLDHSL